MNETGSNGGKHRHQLCPPHAVLIYVNTHTHTPKGNAIMFFHNKRKSILLQPSCTVNISLGHHDDSVIFQFKRNSDVCSNTVLLLPVRYRSSFLYTHPHQAFRFLNCLPGQAWRHTPVFTHSRVSRDLSQKQNKNLSI